MNWVRQVMKTALVIELRAALLVSNRSLKTLVSCKQVVKICRKES